MFQFITKLFAKKEQIKQEKTETALPEQSLFDLSPEQFHEQLENPAVQLIDVRTKEEYEEGHIAGAVLLPVQDMSQEKLDKANIQKEKEVLLYCRSGGRSGRALEMLHSWGYSQAKHLEGGITAWKEKKFAVTKD